MKAHGGNNKHRHRRKELKKSSETVADIESEDNQMETDPPQLEWNPQPLDKVMDQVFKQM